VDDGSTDKSLEMLQAAARRDRRLSVFSQTNLGQSAARNLALEHATGRWVAFVDSDDWLSPGTLDVLCRQAETADLDFILGNGFRFLTKPSETPPVPMLHHASVLEELPGRDWITRGVAENNWSHFIWMHLVRRELITQSGARFFEGIVHEDILWTLDLALAAQRMGFSQQPLYGYRRTPGSTMLARSEQAHQKRARSYIIVIRQLALAAHKLPARSPLRRALLRQANREGGHFLGLMRKKIKNPVALKEIAGEFLKFKLPQAMFQGAATTSEFWRALRCWLVLRSCLRSSGAVS